jgi:hypothetical protein
MDMRSARFHGHGSPLCQEAAGSGVLGWRSAGPGSGLSEEPALGCEPVALESESRPICPPGPVPVRLVQLADHPGVVLTQRSATVDQNPQPLPAADTQRIEASPNPSRRPLFRPTRRRSPGGRASRPFGMLTAQREAARRGAVPRPRRILCGTSRTWPRNSENRSPAAPGVTSYSTSLHTIPTIKPDDQRPRHPLERPG